MALRTFTGALTPDLRWSLAGNWDTGVPADTDTWIIPVGKTCWCDATQAAFATGCGGTINGVLEAYTGAGSYTLKLSANLTGTGTLRAGTSLVAYPQTCTFEIMRNGFDITATNLTLDINCTEPAITHVHLTGAEGIGSTILDVDQSVVGDIWAAGNIIRVDDVNGVDSEERVIAAGGIAAGSITITAGLTNAKIVGALVILVTRNVRITHTAAAGTAINGGAGGTIKAMIYKANLGANVGSGRTIGGTISGCAYGINAGSGHTISGVITGCVTFGINSGSGHIISGTISGCATGINAGSGHTISGVITGCTTGITSGSGHIISGTISGCTTGINAGSGWLLGALFSGNTSTDIYYGSGEWQGHSASFNSATQVVYNADLPAIGWQQVAIWNIGTVAGAFKAWMRGGRVQSQAGVVPTGRTVAYQHICESASYPVFMDRFAEVEPGETVTVNVWLRKDSLMAYLPRCQVFRQENDPLLGGAVLTSVTMTDSLNTWEAYTLTWQNTTVGPVSVVVRTLAMAAANNLYADTEIINGGEVSGGSPFAGVFG